MDVEAGHDALGMLGADAVESFEGGLEEGMRC